MTTQGYFCWVIGAIFTFLYILDAITSKISPSSTVAAIANSLGNNSKQRYLYLEIFIGITYNIN